MKTPSWSSANVKALGASGFVDQYWVRTCPARPSSVAARLSADERADRVPERSAFTGLSGTDLEQRR